MSAQKNYEKIYEEFKQKVNNHQHKNLNNLDIYLMIAKTDPNLKIEAKNIEKIKCDCYKKIGNEENAFKLYEKIANKQIKFDEVVQCLGVTGKYKNDFEIWNQIKKCEDKILSEIVEKEINKYNKEHNRYFYPQVVPSSSQSTLNLKEDFWALAALKQINSNLVSA
ncbi:2669_t:CDS:2 [Gigaspora margarita]|uniref:2669_t:CDS:1 n=1 Tax=Gigaspora margarita TaxID=4874 RepID=A0ABN7VYU5_GIGMA|nr:2669_t:CDS:2 [Gigaspora margarita]